MKLISARTESDAAKWDDFIRTCRLSTEYHQFGWKRVITRSFGHQCHYLAAVDEQGTWQGVLPLVHLRSRIFGNFLVSLPFASYGGVVCRNNAASELLIQAAEELRRSCGATYVELRNAERFDEGLPTRRHKVTLILDMEVDPDRQWQAFNGKLRNQIRKAEKSGLQSTLGHAELLDEFYAVFARNMRDLGSPVYAKRFFGNLLEEFSESSRILTVTLGDKTIAAAIILWFRDTLEVPWASSIGDYKSLCPNNLLYWDAIKFAIGHGFKRFDFGRSTPNEGTYNFKLQWGAKPIPLHWQYLLAEGAGLPDMDATSGKYRAAIRVWKQLPVAITRLIGPGIRKQISL